MPGRVDPDTMQYLADHGSWYSPTKLISGRRVIPVAYQKSRRGRRDSHVYHIEGTNTIVFNQSRHGVYFMRIALRKADVARWHRLMTDAELTADQRDYLLRNDYVRYADLPPAADA